MERFSADPLDRELGRWLRDESVLRAPSGLVEDVFARTSRTPQLRRWWLPVDVLLGWQRGSVDGTPAPRRSLAALGSAAIVVLLAVIAVSLRQPGGGPGSTGPSGSPATPATSPSPSAGISPSIVPPTGRRLDLGPNSAPIDVIEAFDSIWVAEIHGDAVRRFDPLTLEEQATIPVPSAAWFAVADGALWVTSQTDTGVSRIDPATNTVVAHVGDVPPCGAPVVVLDSLWQSACDGGVFLRIDPSTSRIIDTIPAEGHIFLVAAGNRLITIGPAGLAELDPDRRTFTTIGGRAAVGAQFLASDGTTVWVQNSAGVARLDPATGEPIAAFSYVDTGAVTFAGDHAWLTVRRQGVVEIDLATNRIVRTVPAPDSTILAREAGGKLWITDFDGNALWRVDL